MESLMQRMAAEYINIGDNSDQVSKIKTHDKSE